MEHPKLVTYHVSLLPPYTPSLHHSINTKWQLVGVGKVHGGELPGRDMQGSVLILSLTRIFFFNGLYTCGDSSSCRRAVWEQATCGDYLNPREEATGRWTKLNSEKLRELYTASNIIRIFRTKRIRWTIHERDDTYLLTPWSRVFPEKLTSGLRS
jgi:hypothetical protein